MIKKIGIVTALSTALLFGGAFSSSADASAKDFSQNHIYKIFYSINGDWKSISEDNLNDLLAKYMNKFQLNWNEINWDKIHVEKQDKSNAEKPAKNEKPAKEDQADQNDKPAKEQEKSEEPKQPAKEQEKPEEPKQPEQSEETPDKEQPAEEQQPEKQPEQNNNQQQTEEQPSQNEEQAQSQELSQFEQEVVDLTNQERAKQGLPALKVDTELSKVAREKSKDMATNGYFSHNSPNYGSPFDMMKQFGISYKTAGENIAKGQRTPQEVVNAWMNSEGHRANIMNANFTHIGVGYVEQGNHWTQQFIGK
ncbi:MAG: CAP domain-containing protein [Bacillota bacterium]|uniref:SCP domain-containing protein n=1 Tax=Virgibacillus salarius TaxID=447199 RepID=A0A941DU78_9BACI|nr:MULTISPECIES: CAP domain-containing protein [Bacillaceae]NAZ07940.1 hypothetical protein [Agaribacter marinus]MBR7795224.1 hypothetical protein [Virgibacillus salarius]MCC2252005.1 CAP domain-containing protein [Virgibacillus sp. AGTR]MDY7044533.1 CAP domain-containing protein [Virgibacillus sp. M23]QRZ19938.1 hypothetical protein JUJ52_10045 [Virgibacillus sp. AGTR]